MAIYVTLLIKFFFVLTPFFALSMFLSLTDGYSAGRRRKLAFSVTCAVAVITLVLFFAGKQIFLIFGITLDSFRIGAGLLLLLSGIDLVRGKTGSTDNVSGEVTVVPLAIPIIVGPATTGTILVMGAEQSAFYTKALGCSAMLSAVVLVGFVLLAGSLIQRAMGKVGITVLSRITGLILSAMAAQMIMTGIQKFLNL